MTDSDATEAAARHRARFGAVVTAVAVSASLYAGSASAASLETAADAARQDAQSLARRGQLNADAGAFAASLAQLEEAYRIAIRDNDPTAKRAALAGLGGLYFKIGDWDSAFRFFSELRETDEAAGDEAALAATLYNLGHVEASRQRYDTADAYFQRSLELCQKVGDETGGAYALKALGVSAQAQNKADVASALLSDASRAFLALGDARQHAGVERHLGDLALSQETFEAAIVHYQAALPYFEAHLVREPLRKTYRGLAQAYAALHDFRRAYLAQQAYTVLVVDYWERKSNQTLMQLQTELSTARIAADNHRLDAQNRQQSSELAHHAEADRLQALVLASVLLVTLLIGVMFQRSRRHAREMRELALHDELTGIWNRRAVYGFGQQTVQQARQTGQPTAVLIFDIDFFKRLNDRFGHDVGDEVLRATADCARGATRRHDGLGRIGGEEFLLICPDTPQSEAAVLAERLRLRIEENAGRCCSEIVTTSVGVAVVRPGESFEATVKRADEALYVAKSGGRNQVVTAPDTSVESSTAPPSHDPQSGVASAAAA